MTDESAYLKKIAFLEDVINDNQREITMLKELITELEEEIKEWDVETQELMRRIEE